mgnify:CR=1 FL=1
MGGPVKVLQINTCNYGSTGNIMLNISKVAQENGYITHVAYANARSNKKKEAENSILIGSIIERNIHLKLAYYTGLNGCFSRQGTRKFLRQIDEMQPDLIHLHNLHNCYLNLSMLFDYIKEKGISVIWTLHDCWAFTGQCPYFEAIKCKKWETGCFECPQYRQYPKSKVDRTKFMYALKKKWFTGVDNLTIVTPSKWLASLVQKSFLKEYPIKVINNGIDLSVFKPTPSGFREKNGLQEKIILLGVANIWDKRKGLDTFINFSKLLEDKYKIVLVGLSKEQLDLLPENILGLPRTNNLNELAELYSAADLFLNPSVEETMGMVTVEALACGTPAVVSNQTAIPEMIDKSCGIVVKRNDSTGFYETIMNMELEKYPQDNCLKWASQFDMEEKFNEYMKLYRSFLLRKR